MAYVMTASRSASSLDSAADVNPDFVGTPYSLYQHRLDRLQHLQEDAKRSQERLEAHAASLADVRLKTLYHQELNPRIEQLQSVHHALLERVQGLEAAQAEREAALKAEHERAMQEMRKLLVAKQAEARAADAACQLAVRQRQEQAMRRMLNLELSRGFTAWQAMANERRRLMNAARKLRNPELTRGWRSWLELVEFRRRLRNAAARMRSPAVSHAFGVWRRLAIARAAAAGNRSRSDARVLELQQRYDQLERSLEQEIEEKAKLMAQSAELERSQRELHEQFAEREANSLRQRQEQAMRRMLNLELSRGFTAWQAMANERRRLMNAARKLRNPELTRGWRSWLELVEFRRRLRNAAARMRSPAVSHAFGAWRRLAAVEGRRSTQAALAKAGRSSLELSFRCEAAERALTEVNMLMAQREREAADQLSVREAELQRALKALRHEYEEKESRLQEAAMLRVAQRMLQLELSRGFTAWQAMANERRRLMNAARKLRNPELTRGWRSWLELVEFRRRLRNAAARMRSPAVSHAFGAWRRLAEEGRRRQRQDRYAKLEEQLKEAKDHVDWLQKELAARDVAHAHELVELRKEIESKDEEVEAQRAAHNAAVRRVQAQAMRRMLQLGLARGFSAWEEMASERRRLMNAARKMRNPQLSSAWRSWLGLIEERGRLRRAAARMRNPALSSAIREWRKCAVAGVRRDAEQKRKEAEDRFAELKRHCEEVQQSLLDRDAQSASVRRRLEEALSAGRLAVEAAGAPVP